MNIEQASRVAELIKKYMSGELSEKENDELESWKRESSENYALFSKLTDQEWIKSRLQSVEGQDNDALWNRILEGINEEAPVVEMRPVRRIAWWKYAAAAVFVGAVSIGVYFVMIKDEKKEVVKVDDQAVRFKNDVAAGHEGAILTLSSGKQIVVDSAANGNLAVDGKTKIEKLNNGALSYESAKANNEVLYNTLTTIRGRTFKVTLPDGSNVWLNAASSIKYPTVFNGAKREVEITGEAYFSVTKNPSRPFVVKVKEAEIEVLGTEFNVMSYDDESEMQTTLIQGKVKFAKGSNIRFLQPGEQAHLTKTNDLKVVADEDISSTIAWKDNNFEFHNASIESILRQISRWYDVDIVYEATNSQHINGSAPKTESLQTLLKILELTSTARFKLEGRTLILFSNS